MLDRPAYDEDTAVMVSEVNPADQGPTADRGRTNLAIRLAGPSSLDDLARLWVDAKESRQASESALSPSTVAGLGAVRERLATLIVRSGTIALVARLDDAAAAMTVVVQGRGDDGASEDPVPGLAHVSMVAVRPDLWGRRHAETVLRHAMDRAGTYGYRRAQLWTPGPQQAGPRTLRPARLDPVRAPAADRRRRAPGSLRAPPRRRT